MQSAASSSPLPIVVIGAGPVGLAAAAHLIRHGEPVWVLEAGDKVAASVRQWHQVKMFSPWEYNIDTEAQALLEAHGWQAPSPTDYPTGQALVDLYLEPLARLPELQPHISLNTTVTAISREGLSKLNTAGRDKAPFVLRVEQTDDNGWRIERDIRARAIIDASGTWTLPNPLGGNGLPARGESALQPHIYYGIPDVLNVDRDRFANQRVLVVGSGHSAFNALLDLLELTRTAPDTRVTWVIRREGIGRLFGGGANDQLPERGKLGQRLKEMLDAGALTLVTHFKLESLTLTPQGIVATGSSADGQSRSLPPVDEIIGATGFRPSLSMTRELRLALDETVESPTVLAPLIDPNLHSCGSVPPHGAEELKHPEPDFYTVGMKSYGRAPTFLLRTGYEQVRSVVAALRGDWESARRVALVLPETGVCNRTLDDDDTSSGACCGSSPTESATETGAGSLTPLAAATALSHTDAHLPAKAIADCCNSPEGREVCCVEAPASTCCTDQVETSAQTGVQTGTPNLSPLEAQAQAQAQGGCCGPKVVATPTPVLVTFGRRADKPSTSV